MKERGKRHLLNVDIVPNIERLSGGSCGPFTEAVIFLVAAHLNEQMEVFILSVKLMVLFLFLFPIRQSVIKNLLEKTW